MMIGTYRTYWMYGIQCSSLSSALSSMAGWSSTENSPRQKAWRYRTMTDKDWLSLWTDVTHYDDWWLKTVLCIAAQFIMLLNSFKRCLFIRHCNYPFTHPVPYIVILICFLLSSSHRLTGLHAENHPLLRGQDSARQHRTGEECSHRFLWECYKRVIDASVRGEYDAVYCYLSPPLLSYFLS